MTWQFQWGGKIHILREAEKHTGIKSKALASRPKVSVYEQSLLDTFFELNEGRSVSELGFQRLKLADFLTHVAFVGYNLEEAREAWKYMKQLDRLWLNLTKQK